MGRSPICILKFGWLKILKIMKYWWGTLVSHPRRLTGHASRARSTPRTVTWWWSYTTGRGHPMWASWPYPACGHSRRRALPFHFLAIAHARLPLLCRVRRSTRRGQPPPSRHRDIQPGQRECHDVVHLLHRCDRTTSGRGPSPASTRAILSEARTQSTHISTIPYIEVQVEVITN
jgi:hypothetical protein